MLVFLPFLPTREISDTSICIPQESSFGIFLVPFSSSECPHMSLPLGKKLLTNDVHLNTNFSSSLLSRKVWLVPSTSVFSQASQAFAGLWAQGRTFRTFIYLKLDSLENCWWAPPSSPCVHMFWSSCASHNDIFLIYMLYFSGWLIFFFTWNMVHRVRAVFVTVWNDFHFPSYPCFNLQEEGLGHVNQSKTFRNTRW